MALPDYKSGSYKCVHKGPRRYVCTIGHQLATRTPKVALIGVSIYLICFIFYKLFFLVVPGSVLLNVQSAKIPTTRLGEPMVLTLCRQSRIGSIQPQAMRTFYKFVTNGNPEDGGSYSYSPNIEGAGGCYTISIPPARYPKEAGTYYAYTSFKFKAGGFTKEVTFQTEPFLLSDTKETVDRRFDMLQKQICSLNVEPRPVICDTPPAQR